VPITAKAIRVFIPKMEANAHPQHKIATRRSEAFTSPYSQGHIDDASRIYGTVRS